jgi:hypothetical protein
MLSSYFLSGSSAWNKTFLTFDWAAMAKKTVSNIVKKHLETRLDKCKHGGEYVTFKNIKK